MSLGFESGAAGRRSLLNLELLVKPRVLCDRIERVLASDGRDSMTIQELQTQLLSLIQDEKSILIHFLANSPEAPWRGINKTPGVMGDAVCIRDTPIPVWL